MLVMKFGGTSVGTGERIAGVAELVEARLAEGPFVVVSAMGGVTDALLALSRAAREGDRAAAATAIATLGEKHRAAVDALGLEDGAAGALREEISRELARLEGLATGVALLGELSARTTDAICAAGELLSTALTAAALEKRGVAVARVDPREWMATDASHGAATPDEAVLAAKAASRLLPERSAGRVVVTGGFVGAAPDGSTTTLGRGRVGLLGRPPRGGAPGRRGERRGDRDLDRRGRNPDGGSACRPHGPDRLRGGLRRGGGARLLRCEGPSSGDDPACSRARDPGEGEEHVPAAGARDDGEVRGAGSGREGARDADGRRGSLRREPADAPRPRLRGARLRGLRKARGAGGRHRDERGLHLDHRGRESADRRDLVRDLSEFAEVSVLGDLAVVSVVGRKLRSTPRVAASVFAALGDINVVLISQGASETNLTFVVHAPDASEALRRLHRELFEKEAA